MDKKIKEIAKFIYEATRIEAGWSNRSIVPEIWKQRDDKFKKQFVNIIEMYLEKDKLLTPEKAHDSWVVAYEKMGWKYGEKRDVDKKTHPDMLPFNELPKDEKDKDSIFLTFVWLAKQFQSLLTQQHTKDIEKFREIIGEKENVTVVKKSPETEFLLNEIPASQGRNDFRHQLLSELNKL